MIALEVFLNRKRLARAGVGTDGVLTAMTTWVRRPGTGGRLGRGKLSFSLNGFRRAGGVGEHFTWVNRKLEPGDVLTIKVIRAAKVDEPRQRAAEDPALVERQQKRYYRRLKEKFEKARTP